VGAGILGPVALVSQRIFAHMDWNWWCEQVARNQFTTARFISNANLRCHCPSARGHPVFFVAIRDQGWFYVRSSLRRTPAWCNRISTTYVPQGQDVENPIAISLDYWAWQTDYYRIFAAAWYISCCRLKLQLLENIYDFLCRTNTI